MRCSRRSADGEIALTDFWRDFREAARAFAAQLLVIDTAADAFGGDENRRGEVRAFLRACLGALARELDATVLLCAHPSRSGLASGEGDGGNTAWSNSVRSRLYLARAGGDDERERDDNACTLTRKKSNYAGRGDEIKLTWRNGVFVPEGAPAGSVFASIEKRNAETVFLEALNQATAAGRSFKVRDLERAMNRLFGEGVIRMAPYGRPSKGSTRIERIPR
jgi:RecA-family ATPase